MPSILIIDDDVTLLARIGIQLEDAGFEVAKSSDLGHGEQLYVEQRPDLVILEVRSGNNKGWDLLGRLAAETPVLVLSGAAREEDVVRALEEGAIDHIAKPYRSVELLARVRTRIGVPLTATALSPALSAKTVPTEPLTRISAVARAVGSSTAPAAPTRNGAGTPPAAPTRNGVGTPPAAPASPDTVTARATPDGGTGATAPAAPASPDTATAPLGAANVSTYTPPPSVRRNSRRGPVVDETVFMSDAEEMALLRTPPPATPQRPAEPPLPDVGDGGLGRRMRAERQRRHLTLVQIENELKIRMSYLQAIEDEKFTLLPRGPASPQMLKDYADYLGLDASSILDDLKAQSYGEVVTPLPALGGVPVPRPVPRWIIVLVAVLLALVVGVGTILLFDPGFFARLPAFFLGLWAQFAGMFGGR